MTKKLVKRIKYAFQEGWKAQTFYAIGFLIALAGLIKPSIGIELIFVQILLYYGYLFCRDKALEKAKFEQHVEAAKEALK